MINQYECLRCKYKTDKLQNMRYHLNKKINVKKLIQNQYHILMKKYMNYHY
jgi:hypothetical protein